MPARQQTACANAAFAAFVFLQAILSKQRAETLSSVLYPDDRTYEGKELRLKQQHFFVSATVQVRACHWCPQLTCFAINSADMGSTFACWCSLL